MAAIKLFDTSPHQCYYRPEICTNPDAADIDYCNLCLKGQMIDELHIISVNLDNICMNLEAMGSEEK